MDNQSSLIGNSLSDFENMGILGSGKFGTVYKMMSKINNKIYAVKCVEISKDPNVNINYENLKLIREKFIPSFINHPNIVKLYNKNDKNFFVSEFFEGKI